MVVVNRERRETEEKKGGEMKNCCQAHTLILGKSIISSEAGQKDFLFLVLLVHLCILVALQNVFSISC